MWLPFLHYIIISSFRDATRPEYPWCWTGMPCGNRRYRQDRSPSAPRQPQTWCRKSNSAMRNGSRENKGWRISSLQLSPQPYTITSQWMILRFLQPQQPHSRPKIGATMEIWAQIAPQWKIFLQKAWITQILLLPLAYHNSFYYLCIYNNKTDKTQIWQNRVTFYCQALTKWFIDNIAKWRHKINI